MGLFDFKNIEFWGNGVSMEKEEIGMKKTLKRLWFDDRGQDLVEYALMATFIIIAALAIFPAFFPALTRVWDMVSGTKSRANFGLLRTIAYLFAIMVFVAIIIRSKK